MIEKFSMTAEEFRRIYKGLNVSLKHICALIGRKERGVAIWISEGFVKDETTAVLMRLIVKLQEAPYHLSKKEIIRLLHSSANLPNDPPALEKDEQLERSLLKLEAITEQLKGVSGD